MSFEEKGSDCSASGLMSKNELRSNGKQQRCAFANGASELQYFISYNRQICNHGIRDNFPKYVVSLDEFDMSRNGIKHRNIRDFLLAEEWN